MPADGYETEVKFYVQNLTPIEVRLNGLHAQMIQPRILETNIRFDLPGDALQAQGKVLRLRQDTASRLTYKSASTNHAGVLSRQEIEFEVGHFDTARRFLEALGYQKVISYEKYRTTYQLDKNLIMLDELPYGNFVEVEGEDVSSIRSVTDQLNLNWDRAVLVSYPVLFERVQKALNLSGQDLAFKNFRGIQVQPPDLGVRPADDY